LEDDDERRILARMVRQRIESLGRAGVDRIPVSAPLPVNSASSSRPVRGVDVLATGTSAHRSTPTPRPVEMPSTPSPRPAGSSTLAASLFEESKLEILVPAGERPGLLESLSIEVARCVRCPHLAATRTRTVFGEGSPTARLMFVGEAPGADEDRTGRPFVGRAGALLTDMITKGMGLAREEVFIANVLKSRPPENRTPTPEEMANCLPYLERQIEIVHPEFLCLLGKTAASALLKTALSLGRLRGKWHRCREIPTIVTYHPSALLRNPAWKRDAWEDLQTLMNAMGLKPPDRKRPG
jgi:uracil-DNA glycosylase